MLLSDEAIGKLDMDVGEVVAVDEGSTGAKSALIVSPFNSLYQCSHTKEVNFKAKDSRWRARKDCTKSAVPIDTKS